jgi:hypothetical protein
MARSQISSKNQNALSSGYLLKSTPQRAPNYYTSFAVTAAANSPVIATEAIKSCDSGLKHLR